MTMCAEFWEELGLDPANIIRLADATSWTTSPNAIDCAPKIAAQGQDRAIFRIAGSISQPRSSLSMTRRRANAAN